MKHEVLILLLLVCFSCGNKNDDKSSIIKSERFELLPEPDKLEKEKYLQQNLVTFLENPIDLNSFKDSKDVNNITTGVSSGMSYHFHPKVKDSIFYKYNYLTDNIFDSKRIDQIIVFKYGSNKHTYEDDTEILIELRIFNKYSDLGKANLVGLTKTELESEFGTRYFYLDDRIVYSNKNKVLIITLDDSKVQSYNYIKLNTEEINIDLIKRIISNNIT